MHCSSLAARRSVLRPLALAVFLLGAQAQAQAQTLPDPGAVLNEQLRQLDRAAARPGASAPAEVAPPRDEVPTEASTPTITEIQFSRSELLEAQDLRELGNRYVGRALSSTDLQQLLDDIGLLYRARGVATAAAVLPRQDLNSGRLRVLLVEGRLGEVQVKADNGADPDWVKQWFDLPVGEVVRADALRERLVLFNQVSDMSASAGFVPGEQFGVSDLAVELPASPRLQFWSFIESTQGEDAAGPQRAIGLRMAPLGLRGGRLDAAALASATGRTFTASASLPLGNQGWRAGASVAESRSQTRIAGASPADELVLNGHSRALSFDAAKTWVVGPSSLLVTGVTLGTLGSSTDLGDVQLFRTRVNKAALQAVYTRDTGASRSLLRSSLVKGRQAHQGFGYLEVAASHLQPLAAQPTWAWRAGALVRTATSGHTPASELLQLGGTDTVRGHDAAALSGERGYALQLEWRHAIEPAGGPHLDTYAFWDQGRITSGGTEGRLASVGVGLQVRLSAWAGLDLMGSHQLARSHGSRNRLTARLVASW